MVGVIDSILIRSSGGFNELLEELPLLLRVRVRARTRTRVRVRVRVRVEGRFQKQGDAARGSSSACVHHELGL